MTEFLRDVVPFVLPVAAGYLLAQFFGLTTKPLHVVLRYVFFPALLFLLMLDRVPARTFLFVALIGAAMAGVGWLIVTYAPRLLKARAKVGAVAAVPNVACFVLPFLAIVWLRAGLGTACALFVGVSLTMVCIAGKREAHKALVKEPWVYAFLAALLLRLIDVNPGTVVMAALTPLAIGAYALSLVFLGASLYPFDLHCFKDRDSWVTVAARWIAGLAVGLSAIAILPVSQGVIEGIVIVSLAPPATRALSMIGAIPQKTSHPGAVALGTVVSLVAMLILLVAW